MEVVATDRFLDALVYGLVMSAIIVITIHWLRG